MIKTLIIKDFALIDQLEVNFDKGLNVLIGETGAGKSILIDAIDLAFGARSSKEQIRTGQHKSFIELQVELPPNFPLDILNENGIEPEDGNLLIISREITLTGTRSRINGILVTGNIVRNLRECLIDIHSQHETYNYIQPKTHINLLDSYGDKAHQNLLQEFTNLYSSYKQTQKELDTIKSQTKAQEMKIDFLQFQINEIKSAKIDNPYEYEELTKGRNILLNAETLKELTYSSYSDIYGQSNSIIDILNQIESKLIKASEFDNKLSAFAESVSSSSIILKDTADELRDYSENLETDPEKLSIIEERIDQLDKLKRKYGHDLADIINKLEELEHEFNEMEINSEKVEILTKKLLLLEEELNKLSKEISSSRKNLSELLSALIQKELIKLEIPKAQFIIKVEPGSELSSKGIDNVEFFISTNPGEPLKPLAKVASGGEISRIMLAIKTIFARQDQVNTVIFDEIDTGISGKTSQAVGEELAHLAQSHQILCVTHQPIIAAMADQYLYIEKIQSKNTTKVKVNNLKSEQIVTAISKLASGSGDDKDSINFATKLIQQAQNHKKTALY